MNKKLFSLFLSLVASLSSIFAWDYERVQIGDIYYNLDATNLIAEVTESFYLHYEFESVIIPSSINYNELEYSVTNIGSSAFRGCSTLTEITIPNSVTGIGSSAFSNCSNLTSINIPNSVISVGKYAFEGCSSLPIIGNVRYADTYLVEAVDKSLSSYDIQGGTRWIGMDAFRDCSNLTSITIPNSVTYIENHVFHNCSNLKTVTIGNSVTSIGEYAFYRCSALTSIEIPNSVRSIGYRAFYSCKSLTSITIPESVTSIASGTFVNCSSLIEFVVNKENMTYSSEEGVLFDKDRTSLIQCPGGKQGEYNIINTVRSIGDEAFHYCSGLTSIEISNSVTSIGNSAFSGCSGLTKITIPNSVTGIGGSAFSGCSNLTSLTISNTCDIIGDYAFFNCTGISSFTIPYSVKIIGDGAFRGCTSLKSIIWNAKNCCDFLINSTPFYYDDIYNFFDLRQQITSFTFGEDVEHIPAYLCSGLNELVSITIPNSVTSIGENAFKDCTNITYVVWNAKNCNSYNFGSQVESFVFGDEVESIPSSLCFGMSKLTSISIPKSVESIGNDAFYGCTGLVEVEAPAIFFNIEEDKLPYYTKKLKSIAVNSGELNENGLRFIGRSYKTITMLNISSVTNSEFADEAFKGLYNLQTFAIPNLEKISYMMAAECINLQSINIPASVEEIDQRAFENCRSITSVTFEEGSSLTKIGSWAFYNCHELANIDIPEGVEEIGKAAFYGCAYAQELHLPASVKAIGDNGFALCSKIKQMYVDAILPPEVEDKTFYEVSEKTPVYVPDESVEDYKSHPVWSKLNIQGRSGAPTGVDNTTITEKATKILLDGQILILRGEKVYTVTGEEVR